MSAGLADLRSRAAVATAVLSLVAGGALGGCGADESQGGARPGTGARLDAAASGVASTPAPAGASGGAGATTQRSRGVGGSAGVDGGEGFEPKEQLRDLVDVRADGAPIRDLTITWLSGVHLELPPPRPKAAGGILIAVTIDDGSSQGGGGGQDAGASGSDETGYTENVQFALPSQTERLPVTLKRQSGLDTVSVMLNGGQQPSITIAGLPANTAEVLYTTTSASAAELIRANEDCSKTPERQRPQVTGTLADGKRFDALLPDQEGAFCQGKRR